MIAATFVHLLPGTSADTANYHVDANQGLDSNPGTAPEAPWKTFQKVNATTFKPGDRILLKAGGSWKGMLHPLGSGSAEAPITLGAYGDGAKPVIDGDGAEAAVLLVDQQHWVVDGLELRNTTTNRMVTGYLSAKHKEEGQETQVPGMRSGIAVRTEGTERMAGLRIANCDIHSIQGSSWQLAQPGMYENAGIHVMSKAPFDEVLIENNFIHDLDSAGMIVWVGLGEHLHKWLEADPALWGRKTVIRKNRIVNTGADGMIVGCAEGLLIEHNVCDGAGVNAEPAQVVTGNAAADELHIAGIWCDATKDAIIQYNEVARTRPSPIPSDSQAFDVDMACRGTITLQYNYTHDNPGGVLLIMNWNPNLERVIYRYNVSQNDGRLNKSGHQIYMIQHAGQMPKSVEIYNNVFVNTLDDKGFGMTDCKEMAFRNNIFYWRLPGYEVGPQEYWPSTYPTQPVFEGNCFAGHEPIVNDPQKLVTDPKFVEAGKGSDGRKTLDGYRLHPGSPCIGAGVMISDNGGRDFFGNPPPAEMKPAIGIHQPAVQ